VNSLLSRLSGRVSLADMADILERHVGTDSDQCHCREAREALRRMRRHNANFYVRAALRSLDAEEEPCACVRRVIHALRKFASIALR